MKRKRDIQGKFTLKNQDDRQVHSLRLTDSTWKELGLGKQASNYKLVQKSLKRLIELILFSSK